MIVEDDEDILTLYSDYLSNRGYHVIACYTKGNNIETDLEKHRPDVYVINSKLPGNKSGMEVASEILDVYPSAPILFITADYTRPEQIKKHSKLRHKKVQILLKPVKLEQIENTIINLVRK
jgi:DNA-binding response OmpR family regulator